MDFHIPSSEKKICIADDVNDNTNILEIYLKKLGYRDVISFNDPEVLIESLGDENFIPDMFILDIMMPKIDGIELAKRIKSNDKFKYSMIVFATAKSAEESLEECFEAGGQDFIGKPITPVILKCRLQNLFTMQNLLFDLVVQNKSLTHSSLTDGLTQLYNRNFLDTRLNQEFSKSKRYDNKLCVMMLDIDFFKNVNDTHGHPVGDEVLKKVSDILKASLRSSDLVARYGGEEFCVLMPQSQAKEAKKLAERLREKIELTQVSKSQPELRITMSIGLADFEREQKTAKELLTNADQALYRAKENGRNRVEVFDL